MEISEYLDLFNKKISFDDYLNLEELRVNKNSSFKISGKKWKNILKNQNFCCYYCKTDLRIIQELLLSRIINPRKRGKFGFSGMHFELDHKNANNNDNDEGNLVASCYYCNNDKSNTISSQIFETYFGKTKKDAFDKLFKDNNLSFSKELRHHLNKIT